MSLADTLFDGEILKLRVNIDNWFYSSLVLHGMSTIYVNDIMSYKGARIGTFMLGTLQQAQISIQTKMHCSYLLTCSYLFIYVHICSYLYTWPFVACTQQFLWLFSPSLHGRNSIMQIQNSFSRVSKLFLRPEMIFFHSGLQLHGLSPTKSSKQQFGCNASPYNTFISTLSLIFA